jgi:hypothetical protein
MRGREAPRLTAMLAAVWRRSWRRTPDSPALSQARFQDFERLLRGFPWATRQDERTLGNPLTSAELLQDSHRLFAEVDRLCSRLLSGSNAKRRSQSTTTIDMAKLR